MTGEPGELDQSFTPARGWHNPAVVARPAFSACARVDPFLTVAAFGVAAGDRQGAIR
jgi:hypothetical protein